MAGRKLTKTRLTGGVWEGVLSGAPEAPSIEVLHLETPVPGVTVVARPGVAGDWVVRVPIPAALLADGVQTFVIRDLQADELLERFCIIAGAPLEDDLRAEIGLLRAELDLLKRAFRRHCLETAG